MIDSPSRNMLKHSDGQKGNA